MSLLRLLRRLFLRVVPIYRRLELVCVDYRQANELILGSEGKPLPERWTVAPEEDSNIVAGFLWLERRERILE